MKTLFRLGALGVILAGLSAFPPASLAQTTNPPSGKKPAAEADGAKTSKKTGAGPFHGKLAALDKQAKTISVGKRTFHITSETKIKKSGKPATLEDGVLGDQVSGYVKPSADGKLVATTVNFGPKPSESSHKNTPAVQK